MADETVQDSLDAKTAQEALSWLNQATQMAPRWIGIDPTSEEYLELVQEIYDAGAVEVLAIHIDRCPAIRIDDQIFRHDAYLYDVASADVNKYEYVKQLAGEETKCFAVKLPCDEQSRGRVFAWAAAYNLGQSYKWPPTTDYGQRFLLVNFD